MNREKKWISHWQVAEQTPGGQQETQPRALYKVKTLFNQIPSEGSRDIKHNLGNSKQARSLSDTNCMVIWFSIVTRTV